MPDLKLVDAAQAGERACVLVAEEGLNAEPDVLVRHQIRRRLVHQMGVFVHRAPAAIARWTV